MTEPHAAPTSTQRRVRTGLIALIVLSAATLALPGRSEAQGARFGVIAGANFAELRGLSDVDLDKRTGAMGGLSLVLPLGGALALQPEALVVTAGAQAEGNSGDELSLTYAQLPLLLRFTVAGNAPLSPHVYVGPYFGLRIDCTVDIEGVSGSCDDNDEVNTSTTDVGGIVGGGLDLSLGGVVLTGGVRYGFGVSSVADFEAGAVSESARNGSFAVYAGLSVRFGGR